MDCHHVTGSKFDPCSTKRVRKVDWCVCLLRDKIGEFDAKRTAIGKFNK